MPGEIIILQICTINENHICIVPETWSVSSIYFGHFGPFLCPFIPLTTENGNFEKIKKIVSRYHQFILVYHK